jgi:G3E family GTPase
LSLIDIHDRRQLGRLERELRNLRREARLLRYEARDLDVQLERIERMHASYQRRRESLWPIVSHQPEEREEEDEEEEEEDEGQGQANV